MSKGELIPANALALPELSARVDDLLALWNIDLETAAPESLRPLREAAVAALKSGQAHALAVALGATATRRQVGLAMAELIASWPQDKKNDLRTFSRLMAEDVAGLNASPAALDGACRSLRTTITWVPSIAEVVAAVEAQKTACAARATLLGLLPRRIAEVDALLEGKADGGG